VAEGSAGPRDCLFDGVWLSVAFGVVPLLSPLNMRYQMRSARSKIVARGGNIARFDRFLQSRTLRYCHIVTPICGAVLIIAALINP
jgi:hypothetical protein